MSFKGGGGVKKTNCKMPLEKIPCPWNFFRKYPPLEQNSGELAVAMIYTVESTYIDILYIDISLYRHIFKFPNFFFFIFTYEFLLYRHENLPILVYRHAFVGNTHTKKVCGREAWNIDYTMYVVHVKSM